MHKWKLWGSRNFQIQRLPLSWLLLLKQKIVQLHTTHMVNSNEKRKLYRQIHQLSVHRKFPQKRQGSKLGDWGIIEENNLALRKIIMKQLINTQIELTWKFFKALPKTYKFLVSARSSIRCSNPYPESHILYPQHTFPALHIWV